MGSFLGKLGTLASIAAVPLTGGASLAGLAGNLGTIGSILGAVQTAQGLFSKNKPSYKDMIASGQIEAPEKPFEPKRPDAMNRPASLNELAAFSPQQERAALATRGANLGLGSEENQYYRNLLQRSLIGEGGQVSQDQNFLLPIEQQYFERQGVQTGNVMDFLKSIR